MWNFSGTSGIDNEGGVQLLLLYDVRTNKSNEVVELAT
jgi:hypothetical protein